MGTYEEKKLDAEKISKAQLDLLKTTAEIPQANSIQLFIEMLNHMATGIFEIETLAMHLNVDTRTIRYYVDFARWLKFAYLPELGSIKLSDIGRIFAKNIDMRGRLFRNAIFARSLIQDIQLIKRETQNSDTKKAAILAIQKKGNFAESTIRRRASGVTTMLEIAYKPLQIDWKTGEKNIEDSKSYEFEGRAFLTAMAARVFGGAPIIRIFFPRQVREFVLEKKEVSGKIWGPASHEKDGTPWFGNVPVNASTFATVKRGGHDLRSLITLTCPYITLAISMLSQIDKIGRPILRWSTDMYGIRVWYRERDIGTPLYVIEKFCEKHSIIIDKLDTKDHLGEQASDQDLLDILNATGLIKTQDTHIVLTNQFTMESREASVDASSAHERLLLLDELWGDVFAEF